MHRHRTGFGLLEILISFAIIGLGLGGALALLLSSGNSNRLTALRSTAADLAREGIEVVRSFRDSNALQSQPFVTGLLSGTDGSFVPQFSPAGGWIIQFSPNAINDEGTQIRQIDADADGRPDLLVQGGSGTVTAFRRLVQLTAICDVSASNAVANFQYRTDTVCPVANQRVGFTATVTLQWSDRGQTYTLVAREDLFDWHP